MKAVTVKELKTELKNRSHNELLEICLHFSKFKKENKELLTYLLFESENEEEYISAIKSEIDVQFRQINTRSNSTTIKGVRKILRTVKKDIRYSKNKITEIELLLYFSERLKDFINPKKHLYVLKNVYNRELEAIKKKITKLHADLQYDYELRMEELGFL